MVLTMPGNVRPIKIETEMRSSYLDYAMSVIVSRALPDVRDGLKPVHRRILYAMHELGLRPNSSYKKCARIVGEVLGKYHPHGDSPVYDALVRMAQDFTMRYPLIDGQGNFGSVDNDPPAAMRYTEARISRIAEEVLVDIDRDTVDVAPNFDDSLNEPRVLPSRLPNLLVNGSSGIAVGMTTNIPPHNLREVCDAVCYLIDHSSLDYTGAFRSDATVDDLLKFVRGPDFPTAAIIRGTEGIMNAYSTGHGRVVVDSQTTIEDVKGGRSRIIITELPYQVNKASMVAKIADMTKDKKLEGVSDIRDESGRQGLRVVVELSRGAQPEYVLNNLFKHTPLRSTFFINMLALVDGQPRVLSLKAALQHYIDFRRIVVRRRSEYDLRKAQERAHILEGLRVALTHLEEVINLIRNSKDADAAREQLQNNYALSVEQAKAILEMQLRRIAALEREKIESEYQELQQKIHGLEELLADPLKVLSEVKEETQELRKKHGNSRKTQIQKEEVQEYSKESLTPHQDVVVTLSKRGYVKRIPVDTYRLQHRGGKGSRGQQTRDGDVVHQMLLADTHDMLFFFTSRGRVYAQRCFELPADVSRTTRGVPAINIVNIGEGEMVNSIVAVRNFRESANRYLVLATMKGVIKCMPLSAFSNIRRNGLNAMILRSGDELVAVRLAESDENIIVVTAKGQGIMSPVSQIRVRSRQAGGVRSIKLRPKDHVIAMDVAEPGSHILTLSARGYGKLTPVSSYPLQNRGGQGVLAFRITDKTADVAAAQIVVNSDEIVVGSARGMVIRTPLGEFPSLGRNTQGVYIMRKLAPGDRVVSAACLSKISPSMEIPEKPPAARRGKPKRTGAAKPKTSVDTPSTPDQWGQLPLGDS